MAATNIHIPAVRFMTPPPSRSKIEDRGSKIEKTVFSRSSILHSRFSIFGFLKAPFFRHVVLDILDKKSR
jgi:hypothetical protein